MSGLEVDLVWPKVVIVNAIKSQLLDQLGGVNGARERLEDYALALPRLVLNHIWVVRLRVAGQSPGHPLDYLNREFI